MAPTKKAKWKCKICNLQKTEGKDPGLQCIICYAWVGLECTKYSQDVYDYLVEQEVEPNYMCQDCKEALPELHDMMAIRKQQKKLSENINAHDTRITKCELDIENLIPLKELVDSINGRLSTAEAKLIDKETVKTIAETCFNGTEFPSIQESRNKREQTHREMETLQNQRAEWEEAKERKEKESSLIVYGIVETEEQERHQMKSDYQTIHTLYRGKVDLSVNDFLQVKRLGNKKPNQVRPVKLTFASMEKKRSVLRNNMNLKLYNFEFDECSETFCDDEDKAHKHIYVSPDRTKQQLLEDKKLRTELKTKKETDPDLVIRNGKIVKKSTTNHTRWFDVIKDDM